MKFSINRLRSIVFLIAALGYLPLQSADSPSKKEDLNPKIKVAKQVLKTDKEKVSKN